MKPKILNDLTNIFAKLAGSKDYDPKVHYDTPLEYYANQVPVLPKPGPNDAGKIPTADSDGTYLLIAPTVEVSPDAVAGAIADMDDGEVAVVEARLKYALEPIVTNVTGSTPTIALCEDNHIYECGELTSLTITAFNNPGKFWIWFTSGATPTTVTGIDNFTPEENKKYRVFVENGYATFDAWSVGGGS